MRIKNSNLFFYRFQFLNHCAHYIDHLKQLIFIKHNFFKFIITFLKRNFNIVRHSKEIKFIFCTKRFFVSKTFQKSRCRQQFVEIIKTWQNWRFFEFSNNNQTNQILYLNEIVTIVYSINVLCNSKDFYINLLFF